MEMAAKFILLLIISLIVLVFAIITYLHRRNVVDFVSYYADVC